MYELFNRLLCYNIKEGPSLPCGTFTTTAPADEKFSHRSHPNHTGSSARKYQLLPAAFWSFSFFGSQIFISQLCKKTLILGSSEMPLFLGRTESKGQPAISGPAIPTPDRKLPVQQTEMHPSGSTLTDCPCSWWLVM